MGNLAQFDLDFLVNFKENGYVMYRNFFDKSYVNEVKEKIARYAQLDHPGIIKEADGVTFRGIHGPHLYDEFFQKIASNKNIVALAEKVLGEKCYLHQFKINMKQKMTGESWPWHEDFVYWHEKDSIAEPKLVNIALLLDESDMLSGPLCFIPGSHKRKIFYAKSDESTLLDWKNDLSADLNYKIGRELVADMIGSRGVEYALGSAGDLLMFNPLIAHCSVSNLSPYDRRLLILTFNAVSNAPTVPMGRPEFLCGVLIKK
jgi:ectoine hydroxylase